MRQKTTEFLRDNVEDAINYMIPGNDETDIAGGILNNDEL